MSIQDLQKRLRRARGARPRRAIADRTLAVPGGAEVDESIVEKHECRIRTPPADGLALRTHVAALGLPWLECLGTLSYWPPLGIGPAALKIAILRDWCRQNGATVERSDSESGRVVIQL